MCSTRSWVIASRARVQRARAPVEPRARARRRAPPRRRAAPRAARPPRPGASTAAAATSSSADATAATSRRRVASASTASDSITRPSSAPAPSLRTSSGVERAARPASRRCLRSAPGVDRDERRDSHDHELAQRDDVASSSTQASEPRRVERAVEAPRAQSSTRGPERVGCARGRPSRPRQAARRPARPRPAAGQRARRQAQASRCRRRPRARGARRAAPRRARRAPPRPHRCARERARRPPARPRLERAAERPAIASTGTRAVERSAREHREVPPRLRPTTARKRGAPPHAASTSAGATRQERVADLGVARRDGSASTPRYAAAYRSSAPSASALRRCPAAGTGAATARGPRPLARERLERVAEALRRPLEAPSERVDRARPGRGPRPTHVAPPPVRRAPPGLRRRRHLRWPSAGAPRPRRRSAPSAGAPATPPPRERPRRRRQTAARPEPSLHAPLGLEQRAVARAGARRELGGRAVLDDAPASTTSTRSKPSVSPTSWVTHRSVAPRQRRARPGEQLAAALAVEAAERLVEDHQRAPRAAAARGRGAPAAPRRRRPAPPPSPSGVCSPRAAAPAPRAARPRRRRRRASAASSGAP